MQSEKETWVLPKGNIIETIGKTPLIRLNRITRGLKPTFFVKMESFNPGGSVKDRIGNFIVEDAEKKGLLKPKGTIVEATSGNTGMGLALTAVVKGYEAIFTIPDKMSQEKIDLLKALGARVIVCPTAVPPDHPDSYYSVAKKLVEQTPNSILANQYFNEMNPRAHFLTTGPEIWEQTEGQIDHFIAGIGTGGTISGVGKYLKEKKPDVKIVGADPEGSIIRDFYHSGEMAEAHTYLVEGVGEDIIPGTLHLEYVDEICKVTDAESFYYTRKLAREEGIFCGGSSGLALCAAIKYSKEAELGKDDLLVVLLPDTGERYLSKFYSDEWMRDMQLQIEYRDARSFLDLRTIKDLPALISVPHDATLQEALKLMRDNGISQIPVLSEDGKSVGTIKESPSLKLLIDSPDLLERKVEEIMEDPLPQVSDTEDISRVLAFLKNFSAVLVTERAKPIGILSRIDLLDYLSSQSSNFF